MGKYLLIPIAPEVAFKVIHPDSHSRRCNKTPDPTFQRKQFEVHLNPVTKSTKKKEKGKHPKTNLTWQAIIYSEETSKIQID